jgi:hypothetical protein
VAVALFGVPEKERVDDGVGIVEEVIEEGFVEALSFFFLGLAGFGNSVIDEVGRGFLFDTEDGESDGTKAGVEIAVVGGGHLAAVDGGEDV